MPKLKSFIKSLEKLKGYQGLLIFTAKEDLAAWDIIQRWRKKWPQTFRKLKGVFTRNYLTFGTHYNQPSKDLRIIDESLTHVFLIDDNESRVVQKNLNYRIPKFSADFYWDYYLKDHHGRTSDEKWVFESVLDYILVEMNLCQGKQVTECLSKKLGSNDQDLEGYFTWLKQNYQISILTKSAFGYSKYSTKLGFVRITLERTIFFLNSLTKLLNSSIYTHIEKCVNHVQECPNYLLS